MSVHYKFKNNLDHDTVTFDGLSISVADLKKSIMHQKKIGKSSDFDLQITNAQTKEVYDNDETLVPKNTSVIVSRVPVQGGTKNKNSDKPDLPLPIDEDDFGLIRYDRIVKNADLVNANSTEEDKVKAMITQSSQEYDPSKYVKSRSMTGPLPPSYTCFRCGKQGHWIKNCPTNNPDVKRSTGIPRSFMVPVDGPEHKGALLTSSGDYAVPLIDHQAYKEVKKEKPPFVPQDEPVVEPEPKIPEELLCMVCNDLLQDAVLIPCCGNSFCDECVRQVLLESDNHECPVCHETQVSPNTLIPNRFLRAAVGNYKNERGKVSTMVKKAPPPVPQPASPVTRRVDSPQPSPDSTVESQSHAPDTSSAHPDKSPKRTDAKNSETKDAPVAPLQKIKSGNSTPTVCHTPENATPKRNTETDSEDAQPGTPLADEPPTDIINHHHHHHHHLPIQTIGHEHYSSDRYEHSSRYSRSRRDDYGRHYNRSSDNQEHNPISTIETITNMRNKCKFSRPAPIRSQFLNQRSHRDDRSDYDHDDYHGRYEKKHERSSRRTHYDRSDRESRYTSSSHEYPSSEHEHSDSHYDVHQHEESSSRRHVERYRSPPRPLLITPPVPAGAIYTAPVPAVPPIHPPVILPPAPQVFAPQPPPPGASPINTSQIPSQPPPPGVGPPMLPLSSEAPPAFGSRPFDKEDPLKDPKKDERSIDDRMEEFQRKLEKRDRASRDRSPRSRSRSSDRHRSRSSSWSRSGSRSSSRSRSRTPFSSRSRTRSFSHSRSRSWSKKRSYSRSRSRTRTKSRSRSRSRNDSRVRRRGGSRDGRQWSPRSRGRSHSFSPKSYRPSSRRSESYGMKHPYNPPQFPAVSSYNSQYGPPPPAIIPLTVMRPPNFPPHHIHSMHPPPIQTIHSRPIEPYPPVERSMKYPPSYGGQYPVYDVYSQKYQQPKYDREQRFGDHRGSRYDRRSDYPRNEEEVHHRIPGWVGDRSRDYKPRYRNSRDIRGKEIRELPHIPEEDVKVEHAKESSSEAPSKKKEEKTSSKHKKHHHHHKSKETRKQEGKSVRTSAEEHSDSTKNPLKSEGGVEKDEKKTLSESDSKTSDKVKDKKHKHKKHKTGDQPTKKKRSSKKERAEGAPVADGEVPPSKVKTKKKKLKIKAEEPVQDPVEEKVLTPVASPEEKTEDSLPAPEVPEEETTADKPSQDSDVLDIFAEDPEPESADTKAETVLETVEETNDVTDNIEMMEGGNIEETINSEEEVEELIEDENVLRVDVPGISKWEREESEDEESTVPPRRNSVVVPAEESGPISSDIISRAENVLLSKQFKPRIESRDDKNSRDSSEASSQESTPVKRKEAVELKSVVNSEALHSDTLQVIVSNKDKRSVYSRKEEGKTSKSEIQVPKRSRPEKSSHRYYDEPRRPIAAYPSREERMRDYRDKGSDRRELKYSPTRKGRVDDRVSGREHKEYIRRPERDVEPRDDNLRREERKRRFERGEHSSSHDRKKDYSESRSRQEQELLKYGDKGSKIESYKKPRAGSMESSRDSFDSYGKRGDKRPPVEERHKQRSEKGQGDNQESNRRKHSPIKAPGTISDHPKHLKREYPDELKFEPDYDEFSDLEEKRHDVKEKPKKRASSPEIKRAKVEKPAKSEVKPRKPEKTVVTSSSSAVSESDSSDSDEPKGKSRGSDTDHKQKHKKSKHKKHKKHKHKHKKKKSHKSKRD